MPTCESMCGDRISLIGYSIVDFNDVTPAPHGVSGSASLSRDVTFYQPTDSGSSATVIPLGI